MMALSNIPESPDGEVADRLFLAWARVVTPGTNPEETLYTEAEVNSPFRVTTEGDYRIRAETPSDLYITNSDAFEPPHPNYLICDRSGFRVDRHTGLKKEWDGTMVREESWEIRHPQDFVRSRSDKQRGSPRPEQEDTFISDEYGSSGVQVSDLDG